MAEKLTDYEFAKRGRKDKYPWDEWLDGGTYRLVAGDDFDATVKSIQSSSQGAAKKRGKKVRTQIESDSVIVIQGYTPDDGDSDDAPAPKERARSRSRKAEAAAETSTDTDA